MRWANLSAFAIRTNNGLPRYFLAMVEDVTACKRVERERALILEAAGEGIYGLDSDGRTTFVNAAAATLLGWSAEELVGQPMHSVLHHSHPDGTPYVDERCPIYAAFRDGAVHRVEDEVFWRKDGSSFPVEYTSTPLEEGDRLVGAVVVFRDITARKESADQLRHALAEVRALKHRLEIENVYLQDEIRESHHSEYIIGKSKALAIALRQVDQVAPTDATVLVCGETGTGKELIARAIHDRSRLRQRPLVKVNCAALPPGLIESELFGHERGAFTGAVSKRIGRFELADGGTIFLDEIGDLPLELQAKLLRVLQEGEFERLGSSKTLKTRARVVAATNRDLSQAVAHGTFRADLYYRLRVFPIRLPSLRGASGGHPSACSFLPRSKCAPAGQGHHPCAKRDARGLTVLLVARPTSANSRAC